MKRTIFVIAAGILAVALLASCTTTGSKPKGTTTVKSQDFTKASKNIALGKTAKSNNHIYEFTADKAVDGDVNTYYEGAAKAYPNDIWVDLGAQKTIHGIQVKLNPKRIWSERVQSFEILTSDDGSTFTSTVASADYSFSPTGNENSVKVAFEAKAQFVKVSFTANSESTGGQAAELEVYGE